MDHKFLVQLLNVAQKLTQADRGLCVSADLTVLDKHNLDDETVQTKSFKTFADQLLKQAIESNRTIITNNIITDPAEAPTTNTNFSDLRIVIIIPVAASGAIYLDQPIRQGIIQRDIVDRINQMVNQLSQENKEDATEEEMLAIYNKLL